MYERFTPQSALPVPPPRSVPLPHRAHTRSEAFFGIRTQMDGTSGGGGGGGGGGWVWGKEGARPTEEEQETRSGES